jgi:hypothetical protein
LGEKPVLTKIQRARAVRSLVVAGAATALVASAQPAFGGGVDKHVFVVSPGESIQQAVDHAERGDTIRLEAGDYYEAVCIVSKGLTIVGAGKYKTTIQPPEGFTPTECWDTPEQVSALHFENPKGAVTVTKLGTKGHLGNGIVGYGVKGFTVTHTRGVGHGTVTDVEHPAYGIYAAGGSTGIKFTHNVEKGIQNEFGISGTAGISVGDTGNTDAVIAHNKSTGWNLGIFVREARNGVIANNATHGNCVGVLVFDDSGTETNETGPIDPGGQVANYAGGKWSIVDNVSMGNDRFCRAGREGNQLVSGVGMAVVNVDKVRVIDNLIRDNHSTAEPPGPGEFPFPTAGLVVLSLPPFTMPPGGGDPGPAEDIKIIGNTFRNNDLDIFQAGLGAPPPVDITYIDNECISTVQLPRGETPICPNTELAP